MSDFRFCCSFSDFCHLAHPRRFRGESTPDLIALRDAYKADMVQEYPGMTAVEVEVHLALTATVIGDIERELGLRHVGGVDLGAAKVEARRYPPAFIQAVRDANPIIPLIVEDTGQRPKGHIRSSWMIRSPIRAGDDSPSFAVYADGHWYDYGTHEGGDVLTYVMRRHNIPFWQALEFLALRVGVPIPQKPSSTAHRARWSTRRTKA